MARLTTIASSRKLGFLKSNRFWALVLLSAAGYLNAHGFTLSAPGIATFIELVAGGHVVIRTLDRASEKVGAKKEA